MSHTAYHHCVRQLRAELSDSLTEITEQELASRPNPDKWSVAEILEHLLLSYTGTIKACSRVQAAGKSLATGVTWKQRLGQWYVIRLGRMPEGRKAPKGVEPIGRFPATTLPELVLSTMDELERTLMQCTTRFGDAKVIDHPVLGALSAAEFQKFHLIHGRHHIKQIAARREMLRTNFR
ncbi:MAG: DinB family protein [Acidobacteriales bacterium]|nr:DinB family protein [Terriglobales bacterium]